MTVTLIMDPTKLYDERNCSFPYFDWVASAMPPSPWPEGSLWIIEGDNGVKSRIVLIVKGYAIDVATQEVLKHRKGNKGRVWVDGHGDRDCKAAGVWTNFWKAYRAASERLGVNDE